LALAAQGLPLAVIAKQLELSCNTVKVHLRHAYRRTGICSRLEAFHLLVMNCPHCGCNLKSEPPVLKLAVV
jgi:DNA-binding NarL/FixJ family response regulator